MENKITDQINKYTPYKPYSVSCGSKWITDKYVLSIIIMLQNSDDVIVVVSNGDQSDFDVIKKQ